MKKGAISILENFLQRFEPLPDEQLKFLVDFLNMDLKAMHDWAWIKLKEDFKRFVQGKKWFIQMYGDLMLTTQDLPWKDDISQRDLVKLQVRTRKMVEAMFLWRDSKFSDAHEYGKRHVAGIEDTDLQTLDIRASYLLLPRPGPSRRNAILIGTHEQWDVFLLGVIFLLGTEPADRLQFCSICKEKYFYRIKRQKYCSRQCTNREMSRRFDKASREKAVKTKKSSKGKTVRPQHK